MKMLCFVKNVEGEFLSMKKCLDCGKELPDDSLFCQYCGSKNISESTVEINKQIVYKRCIDCGKELPKDSDFCQYCGSKRVAIINNGNDDSVIKKQKSYKTPFIVFLIISIVFIILSLYLIDFNNTLQNELYSMDTKLENANEKASRNEAKANKYNSVDKAISNQTKYNDFYVSTQFVKGTSDIITVYTYHYGSYTITATPTGSISTEWLGQFTGSGTQSANLKINCPSSSYGTVTLTNDWNNEKIVIFVTGE